MRVMAVISWVRSHLVPAHGSIPQPYAARARHWLVDYSKATSAAIARLGDRYLLAHPINVPAPRRGRA